MSRHPAAATRQAAKKAVQPTPALAANAASAKSVRGVSATKVAAAKTAPVRPAAAQAAPTAASTTAAATPAPRVTTAAPLVQRAGAQIAMQRPRTLALQLVEALAQRIRDGQMAAGTRLPTESAIVSEFGVSRTVVREAISKLQASGLVQTRHGVGTFALGVSDAAPFRISAQQLGTLRDVIAVLELRIGVETEAAALAALRRRPADLQALRKALDAFALAVENGSDAVSSDFQFHCGIARATQNEHFSGLLATLGRKIIPRARLDGTGSNGSTAGSAAINARRDYLRRVNAEHDSIYDAIAAQDAESARAAMRTHLANSRERRRRAPREG